MITDAMKKMVPAREELHILSHKALDTADDVRGLLNIFSLIDRLMTSQIG